MERHLSDPSATPTPVPGRRRHWTRFLGRAVLEALMEAAIPALVGGVTGALGGGLIAAGMAFYFMRGDHWLVYVAALVGATIGGLTGAYQAAKQSLLRG